jgi:hypothetical protein
VPALPPPRPLHSPPPPPCLAHAPQAGKRAQPSFYRFKLGTVEITVVSDGTLAFPAEMLWGDRAEDARGLLTSTFQPSSPVGLQINTILVNTGADDHAGRGRCASQIAGWRLRRARTERINAIGTS